MDIPDLLVYVTDDDIRAAKEAWLRARDGGASDERVAMLRRDLESLWAQQARQIMAEVRSKHAAAQSGARKDRGSEATGAS